MLHNWFMDFGGIAFLAAIASFIVIRFLLGLSPAKNSDDKQGRAMLFFFVAFVAALCLVVGFFMSCFGLNGAIPGWIGFGLGGAAFAMLSRAD